MRHGGHPVQTFYLGIPTNATIAASMFGTAAATLITSGITADSVAFMEVYNLTGRNFDLVIGNDYQTTAYTATTPGTTPIGISGPKSTQIFCPGTASSTVASGRGNYFPIIMTSASQIFIRTTENTPITASSTNPIVIHLWT